MGNFSCGKDAFSDQHTLLCRRACGVDDHESELLSCDPAGVVFDDTLRHVRGHLNRAAFRFSGSSNLAALRWLFVFGASPETTDSNGTTLLHVACRTGSLQIVKDLVRRGLSLNVTDCAGWTALHVASCMGRQDVSLYLLNAGAWPGIRNLRGQTPENLCSHPWTKEVVVMYDQSKVKTVQAGFPTRSADGVDSRGCVNQARGETGGASLHFEPFFVPRDAVLHEPRHREELQRLGTVIFNASPGHGVAFLVAAGAVRDYPVEINNFLVRAGADPRNFGSYLGEEYPVAQTLRLEFLNSLPLLGTGVVSALETAFHDISVPEDWQKADRLTRGVAHFWWRQHDEEVQVGGAERGPIFGRELPSTGAPGELAGLELQRSLLGTEALHRLMFSALMLHQWLRGGRLMSLGEWTQLNMGIECNGNDVPMHVQTGIYKALTECGNVHFGDKTGAGAAGCAVAGATAGAGGATGEESVPTSPRAPALQVTIEGCARIRYSGRAQTGQGSDAAAWPDATPRLLAAQGGVLSAGRSSPVPPVTKERACTVLEAAVPVESFASVGSCGVSCAGLVGPVSRASDEASASSAIATPVATGTRAAGNSMVTLSPGLGVDSLTRASNASGEGVSGATAEAAWLRLHGWILLLSTAAEDMTPYGFVSLRHAVIREADPAVRRLVLSSRSDGNWPPVATSEDDWLDLCLLLGDGRFQAMEAPELEMLFTGQAEFEQWKVQLESLRDASQKLKLPAAKAIDMKLPAFLSANMSDETTIPVVPLLPGEDDGDDEDFRTINT